MRHLVCKLVILCIAVANLAAAGVIEGFESGNLSAYTFVKSFDELPVVSSAAAHDGTYGLDAFNYWWSYRDDAAVHTQQGDILSVWVKFMRVADERAYFGFGSTAAGTLSFVLAPNNNTLMFQENAGYQSYNDLNPVAQTYAADHWYRAEVIWGVGGSLTGNLYDSNGTTLLNSVTANSSLTSSGGIAFRGFGHDKAFDTVEKLGPVVPEPASATLLLLGAGLVWFARRRLCR